MMEVLRFRPILVTFLLILLYGSGSLFVISLSFIGISIIATFICFIFKIQLDFEFLFSFIEKFQNVFNHKDGTVKFNKQDSFGLKPLPSAAGNFRDLPRPIARKLKLIIDGVMNEFVESWYIQICPEDRDFVDETRRALEQLMVEGYKRICNADTHSVAVNLINLLTSHLKIFNNCRDAVHSKYPGINATDFERCITELYEARITQHISSKSQGSALDFLRKITDILLYVLLPKNAFSCEGGRFMLREILAIQGLQRLVELLSDPHFINKALIDIFEESIPKDIIQQQWNEELGKEIDSDDDMENSKGFENKVDSDIYESATEGRKKDDIKEERIKTKRTKHSSYSSIEHINEISDNLDSKFATPRHSTTEWSSEGESFEAFDRVLRQNQLEARSSAPVYGSTTVKLHEKSDGYQISSLSFPVTENKHPSIVAVTKSESGVFSESTKIRSSSIPIKLNSADRHMKNTLQRKFGQDNKFDKKHMEIGSPDSTNDKTHSRVIPIKEGENEPWNDCPPPESSYYRKISYKEMNRSQDMLKEQVKAKLQAFGSNVSPTTCLASVMKKEHKRRHRSLPDLTTSFEGSMAISIPENHDIYEEMTGSCKREENMSKDKEHFVCSDEDEFLKIHSVPKRNIFYEMAPDCPTCIEMTSLASPLENGKAVSTVDPKSPLVKTVNHECGLSVGHFYHPELEDENLSDNASETESFISCDSYSLTDLDSSIATNASESTLLASSESIGNGESSIEPILRNLKKARLNIKTKSSSVESFDVVSLKDSDSEFSSANEFGESGSTQCISDLNNDLNDRYDAEMMGERLARAPSITTFASAFDSSTQENTENSQFKTPFKSKKRPRPLSGMIKRFTAQSVSIKQGIPKPELPGRILKSLKELRVKRNFAKKELNESSDDEPENSISGFNQKRYCHPPHERKKHTILGKLKFQSKQVKTAENISEDLCKIEQRGFQSSFSGTTDSDQSYLQRSPETPSNTLPIETIVNEWQKNALKVKKSVVEEVADEINEEFEADDCFKDARSIFEERFEDSLSIVADSLGTEDESNLADDISVVNDIEMEAKVKTDGVIPIYQGEVILPHPSKMLVSAWMYPMQMISIPKTEVAFEKGWEPGGNKYTLYSIHYDIRIWPEIYQGQMIEASQKAPEGDSKDSIPIIREIKRRYREFMYLHNRLTHSQMSDYMKGVLRPNRRYGMPFGRMDPDVIEGRRKILEAYLVSLVSRPEVCNSREFREFLGAEGYGVVSFIKPKVVQPKQMVNKMIGSMKNAFPGSKDVAERGESSQYFIHGYDVPRMFGYADSNTLARHSSPWFSSFAEVHENRDMLPEGQPSDQNKINVIGKIEFFQRPKLIGADFHDLANRDSTNTSFDILGPRSSGDGSDCPEPSRNGFFNESPDRRFSVGIPALFSNELARRSRSETLSTLDARKVEEDIPWPLSDAVMSFLCQGLRGYSCWLTYENVQQALLYSLGGLLEWQIAGAIDEIVVEERWMKYLNDLYHVIWEDGKLKDFPPDPTEEEKRNIKEEALQKMLDFLPGIVRIIIGSDEYRKWGDGLLHALQYQKINRHLLFAVIDLAMGEFIPELQTGYYDYKLSSASKQ